MLQGFRFLVMERLGRTLEAVLRDNGPVPPATAARLGYNIVRLVGGLELLKGADV